jgi:hypothetical protein
MLIVKHYIRLTLKKLYIFGCRQEWAFCFSSPGGVMSLFDRARVGVGVRIGV